MLVGGTFGGQALFLQPSFHKEFDGGIEEREKRNADEHADRAEQLARDRDGDDYPKRAHADGLADDGGADDVAVDLLDDQHDEHEDDGHGQAIGQHDDGAGNTADEGLLPQV